MVGKKFESIKTIVFHSHGKIEKNFEYQLKGTPCETVVGKNSCIYQSGVQELFSEDKELVELGVESYVGAPLFDSANRPLGILVVMSKKPLLNSALAASQLNIYAVRAAAELERIRYEDELQKAHDDMGFKVEERTRQLSQEITERKFIEKELIDAREHAEVASRVKSDLMANMSHELRTPLNAIIGFSSSMQTEMFGTLNEKYLEYADDINSSGVHLLELINDILDVSAIEAGKLELNKQDLNVGDIFSVTTHMIENLAISGGIHLKCTFADGLPRLHADKRRLTQILLNLLSNAIKFTLPDGDVSLIASLDGEDAYIFTVTDTGIGMDKKELANAMSKFGQVESGLGRRREGTGLGLPLAKELVELHGGTLNIESEKDQGTTVTVRFPPQSTVVS